MASPFSVAAKIVVSVGLITGALKLATMNSTTRNDIVATRQNIQTLKQETKQQQHMKVKRKVTGQQFHQAEMVGQKVATALTKIMAKSNPQPKPVDFKASEAQLVVKHDATGADHKLILGLPYSLGDMHVTFVHGGATTDGTIRAGFLVYNAKNQLQGVMKCLYDPTTQTFDHYHFVPTKGLSARNVKVLNDLGAGA